jgi:hypothetical protein
MFIDKNADEIFEIIKAAMPIQGDLSLRSTQVTHLPDGLQVGGWLDLVNTQITHLPDGLKVGGYLDLADTTITRLPDGLVVGEWLDLSGTKITTLPADLKVSGEIMGFEPSKPPKLPLVQGGKPLPKWNW